MLAETQKCEHCPGKTPLRPDPASIQRARDLYFDPPLDEASARSF